MGVSIWLSVASIFHSFILNEVSDSVSQNTKGNHSKKAAHFSLPGGEGTCSCLSGLSRMNLEMISEDK